MHGSCWSEEEVVTESCSVVGQFWILGK